MIKIKNLNKIFKISEKKFYALKDINLNIKKSELVTIYGKSGSGKSTLLSIIASIMKPTDGAVYIEGENIVSYNDYFASLYRQKTVGIITQDFYLFDLLNVRENIKTALIITDISTKEINNKVENIAKLCNIHHKLDMPINTLSGGEKQRCTIARALINNPKILLCDEPTANLDYENSLIFIEILIKLKKTDKTIIIATHDPLFKTLDIVNKKIFMNNAEIETHE